MNDGYKLIVKIFQYLIKVVMSSKWFTNVTSQARSNVFKQSAKALEVLLYTVNSVVWIVQVL